MAKIIFQINSASAVLNLALNLLLIPAWQSRGAAAACSATYIFTTLCCTFYFLKRTGKTFKDLVPTRQDFNFYPARLRKMLT